MAPHFVLYSSGKEEDSLEKSARWSFAIHTSEGEPVLNVSEHEPNLVPERAELLATVRALEALDQPSQVTLVISSRYVYRGMRFGLHEWRHRGWKWELFGELVPIKNDDLWRRVDRALSIHRVRLRWLRHDQSHSVERKDRATALEFAPHIDLKRDSSHFRGVDRNRRLVREAGPNSWRTGQKIGQKCGALVRQVLGKRGLMPVV